MLNIQILYIFFLWRKKKRNGNYKREKEENWVEINTGPKIYIEKKYIMTDMGSISKIKLKQQQWK